MPKEPKHILVIRLSAMGDVAIMIPVLSALNKQYPELKITVLTRAFFKPFFRDLPNVSVFAAELNGKHKGVFGLYKLAKQLNKENNFDVIADLHSVLRSKILKKFLRYERLVTIDKGRKEKRLLISGQLFEQLKTSSQRYADVFETLGYPINLSHPSFPEPKKLNSKSVALLGDKKNKWIGIAPFAAHEGKMYPMNLMMEVIKTLSTDYKVILFGGGKKEINSLDTIESEFENLHSIAGKLSLEEELDVISNLDIMLSMDSGNAHIAAMLGLKVITIWGVTHPFAGFAPFNQPEDYALLPDRKMFPKTPTSVYGNKFPQNYKEAAGSISPETVIDKIKSII